MEDLDPEYVVGLIGQVSLQTKYVEDIPLSND